jgi:hypothetical protein
MRKEANEEMGKERRRGRKEGDGRERIDERREGG